MLASNTRGVTLLVMVGLEEMNVIELVFFQMLWMRKM
jgi:hypothetical protein